MAKMIQVRNVPDKVHRRLKARAARQGLSLSGLIKKELERFAEEPSTEEWLERTKRRTPILLGRSSAEIIRELRDER
jgi:antitoxin FitA